jgi:hypothetical protein
LKVFIGKNYVPFNQEVVMKNIYTRLAICLAGAYVVFLMIGCTKEKTTEIKTIETVRDTSLLTGFAPGIQCALCHNADVDTLGVNSAELQYTFSVHASTAIFTSAEAPTLMGANCTECHTSEGYVYKLKTGTSKAVSKITVPDCFACHSPHTNGNFNLRSTTPVTLASNITNVSAATFDYGAGGNLCVSCHHPRTLNPLPPDPSLADGTDTLTITNSRWYPHMGVQGQMLMGAGGYELKGSEFSAAYGNYFHGNNTAIKQNGCPLCHMAKPNGVQVGGHAMGMEDEEGFEANACNVTGCHSGLTNFDHNGKVTAVQSYMDTLKTLLVANGWIDASNNILNGRGVTPSSSQPLKITPKRKSGALFNYLFVLHDGSNGVHNAEYAIALLQNSLVEIRK